MQSFEDSVKWAVDGKFTVDDIEEAKLSVFASIDSPISPGRKGFGLFSQGITNEMRQQFRDRLFEVGKDDLLEASNRYLFSNSHVDSVAIIGPENEDICKDNSWNIQQGL